MLTRGGIEFLAVLLGITLSLYIDQQAENRSVAKTEMALLSAVSYTHLTLPTKA